MAFYKELSYPLTILHFRPTYQCRRKRVDSHHWPGYCGHVSRDVLRLGSGRQRRRLLDSFGVVEEVQIRRHRPSPAEKRAVNADENVDG